MDQGSQSAVNESLNDRNVAVNYSFENLPDVILLKVFEFLSIGDLCKAGRVCVRWYHLSRTPILWRNVDAHDMPLTPFQVEKLIPVLPSSVLYLRICSMAIQNSIPFLRPHVVMAIREHCPLLRTLIIENAFVAKYVHYTDITVEDLPQNLAVLSLRKSFFHTDQFFCSVSHPTVPKIKVLDCSACWCIRDYDLTFFTRLSDLQEVYLSGCYISDHGVEDLLKLSDGLKVLDLEATFIKDRTVQMLSEKCKGLEKLFLGNTNITDLAFASLCKSSFPKLSYLCITKTLLTEAAIVSVVQNLKSLKHISISTRVLSEDNIEPTCISVFRTAYKLVSYEAGNLGPNKFCDHFLDNMKDYKY